MAKISDLISTVLKELIRLQTAPSPYRDENDPFPFPRMIGVGDGRSIVVSQEIDDAIQRVADQLIAQDPSLTSKYMLAEWRKMVRASFGPALAMIDLDDPVDQNVATILSPAYSPKSDRSGCVRLKAL